MKRFFLALWLANAVAATASPTQAIEGDIEAGRHAEAVRRIDEMERQSGRSPRLESMRAVALEATGDKLGALRSLLAYTDLTRSMNLRDNEAHAALVEMRDRLRNELREEYRKKKDEEESRRRREGAETTRTAAAAEQAEGQRFAQAYTQRQERLIEAALRNPTAETIESLKRETNSSKTDKLDARALRVADLDTGDVRLGMPLAEFAAMVTHRVKRQSMQTSLLKRYVEDFRFKLDNERWYRVGLRHGRQKEVDAAYGSAAINDLWDRVYMDQTPYAADFDRFDDAVAAPNQPAGLALLVPEAVRYRVTQVKFDAANRVQAIRVHFVMPWAWRDVNGMRAAFVREFGPPSSDFRSTHGQAKYGTQSHWTFFYSSVGRVQLRGDLEDGYSDGERSSTYVLKLELSAKP